MSAQKPVDVERDGLVLANRETLADLVVREACETEPADPDDPDTIKIKVSDLRWVALSAMLVAEPEDAQDERRSRDAAVERLIAADVEYDEAYEDVIRPRGRGDGVGLMDALANSLARAERLRLARTERAASLAAVRGGADHG